jgi:PAS domain S-box-containing protein
LGFDVYLFASRFLPSNFTRVPVAPLYVPVAVILAVLLLTPPRRWGLFLGVAFAVQVALYTWFGYPLGFNLVAEAPTVIEPLIAAYLLSRLNILPPRFASLREVTFYASCVIAAAMLGALSGARIRASLGFAYWPAWLSWFLSDSLAMLVLAPALVLWAYAIAEGLRMPAPRRRVEIAVWCGLFLLLGLVAQVWLHGRADLRALILVPVPLLLWAAVRFGPRGLASALALLTVAGIIGVVYGRGPFDGLSISVGVLTVQLFLAAIGVPLLFLAALVQERNQADAALQASEARYRDVVESQTELITRYLPDTTITFVNTANCRSMGMSWEQLVGTKFLHVLPDSEREPVLASIQSLLAHPGVSTIEHQVRLADGSFGWQQWVNRTILDGQGQVIELQGIGRDITERKHMEQALQESEARYHATFDSAAIGVAVVDLTGRPLEVNAYICQMVGYTADELRARSLRDFTHPDDVADNEALLRRALDGDIESYQLERRYLHKSGHLVWCRLSASLVRDQDGQPAYFVVHLEDVTQRKRVEQEREAAIAQLEALQAVTDTALTHLGLDDLLPAVLDRIHAVLDLDHAAIRLLEPDGRSLGLATASVHARVHDELLVGSFPVELGQGFAGRIAASREPLVVDDMSDFPFVNPALRGRLRSAMGVPLLLDGRLLGVLYSGSTTPRHFTPHEVRLLQLLAERVAIAVERAQLYEAERQARARAAARTAELEAVLNGVTDGVIVYDRAGHGTYLNPALRAMAAYAPPDYEHRSLSERAALTRMRTPAGEVVPADELPQARLLRGEVLAGAASPDLLFDTQDGRTLTVQYAGSPLRDATGAVSGAVMVLRNVTDERRLEHERAEQAAQLDRIFEGITDGVVVYDTAGQVVRTNPAARRLLGLDAAPAGYALLRPADRAALFAAHDDQGRRLAPDDWRLMGVLRGEGSLEGAGRDMRLRTLDGREVDISTSTAPLRDAAGHLVGAVTILHDQTHRKRLEREHEAARTEAERRAEELDRVFEAMADGVAVYDQDGREVRTNTALHRLIGLDGAPPDYAELSLPERMALFAARDDQGRPLTSEEGPLPQALRGEIASGSATMDLRAHALDGRELELSVSAAPLRDAAGRVTGAVALYRDHTERRRLERSNAEQAEQLNRIFEQIGDALSLYDAEGHVVRANLAARRLLGPNTAHAHFAELPPGQRLADLAVRDEQGRPLAPHEWPVRRVLRGEVPTGADVRDVQLRTLDGHELELTSSTVPLRDAEGRITGAVNLLHDQTERKRLEREREAARVEAERQAAELAACFDAMADGVAVFDAQGHLVRENAALRRLLGLEGAVGPELAALSLAEQMELLDVHDEQGPLRDPSLGPLPRALRGEVVSGAETRNLGVHTFDGRTIELGVSAAPQMDRDGQVTGAVVILRDQTERQRLEQERAEALARAQARSAELEAVLGAMTDGVIVYDPSGHITYTNAAFRTLIVAEARPDYERLALAERATLARFRTSEGQGLPLDQLPQVRVLRGEVLASGEASDLVSDALDGRPLTLQVAGSPLRDAAGDIIGAVLVLRDMTERRRLQREWEETRASELALQEVNQRLDTFVKMAVHDLRSPVGVSQMVVHRAQHLLRQAVTDMDRVGGSAASANQARAVTRAVQAVDVTAFNIDRLMRLVEQLLDVARVKEGTLVLQHQLVDLAELVRTGVDEQRLLNPSRVIACDLLVPEDPDGLPLVVDADADRLSQVLSNYLSNAVRYSPEDQPIEVALRVVERAQEGGGRRAAPVASMAQVARVEVRDHGPGIAPEDQPKIWNQFQRAHSVEEAKGGLGLGLYIVRTLIELHGGQVGVDSAVGEGSTFWFTLPLNATPA